MKKILILNPNIPTLGGGEKKMAYFCHFIETYFNNNVRIDILVFNNILVTIEDIMRQFNLNLKCTYIKFIKINFSKNILAKINNWFKIENMTKSYDLFVNFFYLGKHRGKAKKNIYICMFPPKQYGYYCPEFSIKKTIGKLYQLLFYKSYDIFIPISKFAKHWLDIYCNKNLKSTIIFPPAFLEEEAVDRYNEKEKTNIILSVGRFFVDNHCKKQLEMVQFFIDHINLLMDYEYHLAGMVDKNKKSIDYINMIKKLSKKSCRVFLHENCTYEELISLYRQAKIFWHATGYGIDENKEPEKMEHFGITTVEAMSYGVVPVVINKGGQPEIVDDDKNGYIWNDQDECINKTISLISNEQRRKEMASDAVEKARTFSIESFYLRNKEVFDELRI